MVRWRPKAGRVPQSTQALSGKPYGLVVNQDYEIKLDGYFLSQTKTRQLSFKYIALPLECMVFVESYHPQTSLRSCKNFSAAKGLVHRSAF